jgi:energy-coupling factor transporter ATP-binding protein EcfA2
MAMSDAEKRAASGDAKPGGPSLSEIPAVEFRDVHFHYPTSDGCLHGISLTIAASESVALIGPNGAGKSTLLLHLNGILPESPADGQGSVHIFGRQVTHKNLRDIRRDVGLLFQEPDDQLFCPTVFDDVAFGPKQFNLSTTDLKTRVAKFLEEVGLSGFENRSPHRLSGGEKRRVCLAGVLACEPRLLALDEPTSNLDPRARRHLITLLRELPTAKIIATHDLEMVLDLCPRVILLDAGQVIADGPAREILSNETLMLNHGLEVPHSCRVRFSGRD